MLRIFYYPSRDQSLHFIFKRTDCCAVKRNKMKRVVKNIYRKNPTKGQLVVGVKRMSKPADLSLKELALETRKDFAEWMHKHQ